MVGIAGWPTHEGGVSHRSALDGRRPAVATSGGTWRRIGGGPARRERESESESDRERAAPARPGENQSWIRHARCNVSTSSPNVVIFVRARARRRQPRERASEHLYPCYRVAVRERNRRARPSCSVLCASKRLRAFRARPFFRDRRRVRVEPRAAERFRRQRCSLPRDSLVGRTSFRRYECQRVVRRSCRFRLSAIGPSRPGDRWSLLSRVSHCRCCNFSLARFPLAILAVLAPSIPRRSKASQSLSVTTARSFLLQARRKAAIFDVAERILGTRSKRSLRRGRLYSHVRLR